LPSPYSSATSTSDLSAVEGTRPPISRSRTRRPSAACHGRRAPGHRSARVREADTARTYLVRDPVAESTYDLATVVTSASRSSDSGSTGARHLPRALLQWRVASPVTLTAARQSRNLTGFPDSTSEVRLAPSTLAPRHDGENWRL